MSAGNSDVPAFRRGEQLTAARLNAVRMSATRRHAPSRGIVDSNGVLTAVPQVASGSSASFSISKGLVQSWTPASWNNTANVLGDGSVDIWLFSTPASWADATVYPEDSVVSLSGGAWAPSTAYSEGDTISNEGSVYVATSSFTSPSTFSTTNLLLMGASGALIIANQETSDSFVLAQWDAVNGTLWVDRDAEVTTLSHNFTFSVPQGAHIEWSGTDIISVTCSQATGFE